MWEAILLWLRQNQVGDLTGVVGVAISSVGFLLTLIGVRRAEKAAREAKESIRLFETAVDFSAAIAVLEEIKRAHRDKQWSALPDRYAAIRKVLISLRTSSMSLSDAHLTLIQTALVNLRTIEQRVERNLQNPAALDSAKLNAVISDDIDNLFGVLNEIKAVKTGAS